MVYLVMMHVGGVYRVHSVHWSKETAQKECKAMPGSYVEGFNVK